MFTHQHIRDEIKDKIKHSPLSCMLPCTVDWMLSELNKLPAGSTVVEFGTFVGGTTAILAKARPDVLIHSIDLNNVDIWEYEVGMSHMIKHHCELPELKTSDLLEIQKIESGDYQINVRKDNIIEFLKNIIITFEPLADRQKIKLIFVQFLIFIS